MTKRLLPTVSLFVLCACLFAQTPPNPEPAKPPASVAPVSTDEEIQILSDEKEQLSAQQALNAVIQALPQYKRAMAANDQLQKDAMAIYSSRKVTNQQYALCDGPSQPGCEDVKQGRIALRPVPKTKPEEKK